MAARIGSGSQLTPELCGQLVAHHLRQRFPDPVQMAQLGQRFRRDGYLKITEAIPAELVEILTEEVHELVAQFGVRRDIHVKETGNSPRKMCNVSRKDIAEHGSAIPTVYACEELKEFLGELADDELVPCPWSDEEYIITRQDTAGDTHGWHWGDYPFTVIWVIEAPAVECGGMLQCVPHTKWDKQKPRVNEILIQNPIRSYHHDTGDVYFLQSQTTLHRTVPLTVDERRVILNTCWGSAFDRRDDVEHETMLQGFVT